MGREQEPVWIVPLVCSGLLPNPACLHPSIVAQVGLRGFLGVNVLLFLAGLEIHLRSFAFGQ